MPSKSASTPPKRRLGRGLSSLISQTIEPPPDYIPEPTVMHVAETAATETAQTEIPIDSIETNPYQPRSEFDDAKLEQLAQSIRQQGILQPLLLAASDSPESDKPYRLIAGERRLRAARLAGLDAVPAVIKAATSQQMLEWALIENIHREDLNPIERAKAYREYLDKFNLTQAQGSEKLGQPRATIANFLRLLDLCDSVQGLVLHGQLSLGHAKVLAGLSATPELQQQLAEISVAENLSVRALETILSNRQKQTTPAEILTKRRAPKSALILDLEERLLQSLGTRVSIRPARKANSGRIIIDYYSVDDFDRIAGMLGIPHEI